MKFFIRHNVNVGACAVENQPIDINQLIDEYKIACSCYSFTHLYRRHKTYAPIVAQGKAALPFIFARLRAGSGGRMMSALLEDITGVHPYSPKPIDGTVFNAFDIRAEDAAWMDWGRTNGFIPNTADDGVEA